MRVTLSFVTPPGRLVLPMVAGLGTLVAGSVVLAVWAVVCAVTARNDLPTLKARAAGLAPPAVAAEVARSEPLPPRERLLSLRERVARINGLGGKGGEPILNLLARLESVLPDEARIVSLRYASEQGITTLVAEAGDDDTLNRFLEKLERSGQFAEVLLTRQTQQVGNRGLMRQFELRLKERA